MDHVIIFTCFSMYAQQKAGLNLPFFLFMFSHAWLAYKRHCNFHLKKLVLKRVLNSYSNQGRESYPRYFEPTVTTRK